MKTVELTKEDLEVIKCLIDVWDENDAPLPSGLTYNMAFETLKKLGFEPPETISAWISMAESMNL